MNPLAFRQIHLDFHTSEQIAGVADEFDARGFAETLRAAHVNSVTLFARCHHGMIYYDSKRDPERVHPGLGGKDLLRMQIDAGRAAGMDLEVASAWRDWATQETLFENKVSRVMAETGLGREEAGEIAADEVARPGTSEHQLGLAVDINGAVYDVYLWLEENSWKYGFIFRYPAYKTDITGIEGEVWHYRYVGKEAAREIYEQGVCLEEYLENLPEDGAPPAAA